MDPRDQLFIIHNAMGTKATAKSIIPLFYIFLVEENMLTRGGLLWLE